MKRIFLALLLVTVGLSLAAQNVDKARKLLQKKKLSDAKTQIDKAIENSRRANNPETWYTKARIYIAIADDSTLKLKYPTARDQAFVALKQYIVLNRKHGGKMILLQQDHFKPLNDIYQGYYRAGAALFNSSNFKDAFITFKKGLEVSDSLIANKWTTMTFDTTVTLYIGIAAEKSNKKDTAAVYYTKLTDRRIVGKGLAEIYKWLTNYYNRKQDAVNTRKFLQLGKELYPDDLYWLTMELEMAINSGDRTQVYKKYEEIMRKDPANYIYPYKYAVELYKEAYPASDTTKRLAYSPAKVKQLTDKATSLIRKSLELKPDYLQSNLVMGQILYNQGVELSTQQRNSKPGAAQLTEEEMKHKENLKAEMLKKFDEAIPFLEKVGNKLGGVKGKLRGEERNMFKNVYYTLTNIYYYKQSVKDLPEDQKLANKKKMEEYQDKYNNVDKIHR